ncbi:MAG TPA: hypothetical protein VHB21_17280, partial [Minicystis sp.]|nr:hypothetical protein [Minicystis sp.]
ASGGTGVIVFWGKGGSFTSPEALDEVTSPAWLTCVHEDPAHPDHLSLAVLGASGVSVVSFDGTKKPTIGPRASLRSGPVELLAVNGGAPSTIVAADVTGDGIEDIVVGMPGLSRTVVLPGLPTVTP